MAEDILVSVRSKGVYIVDKSSVDLIRTGMRNKRGPMLVDANGQSIDLYGQRIEFFDFEDDVARITLQIDGRARVEYLR